VDGVNAAIRALESAERYFVGGAAGASVDFTGAIQALNLAFEQMLRETHAAAFPAGNMKMDLASVEQALDAANILPRRVVEIVPNYRRAWRNKSSHDATQSFSKQDATVAIAAVSALSVTLLDAIVELVREARRSARLKEEPATQVSTQSASLVSDVCATLTEFLRIGDKPRIHRADDQDVRGEVREFLHAVAADLQMSVRGPARPRNRSDLLLRRGSEKLVVELMPEPASDQVNFLARLSLQMSDYVRGIGASGAIICILPPSREVTDARLLSYPGTRPSLWLIGPRGY
jgi:hypothetical protein